MLQPIRSLLSYRLIRYLLSVSLLYLFGLVSYAQAAQVTVLNQAIATSHGSGAGGTPNISGFNIPAGKNRVLFIFAAFERDHCDLATDDCDKTNPYTGVGSDNYARPVTTVNQITARVAGPSATVDKMNALTIGGSPSGDLRFVSMETSLVDNTNTAIPNSTLFSVESYHIALMESEINTLLGGAGSGAVTITLPDANVPKSEGDDTILMAYVFNNVDQTDSGIVRSAVANANGLSGGTAGNYTLSAASLDAGQAPNDANDGFLVVGTSLAGLPTTNGGFNAMAGYTVLQTGVTTNSGGRFDNTDPTYVTSEPDGLSTSAQFKNGVTSNFTLQSAAASSLTVAGGWAAAFTLSADNADTSDAPSSYGSPSHTISGIRLGASVDADAAALASADALGDDTNGTDDENGVTMPTSLTASQTVSIPVSIQSASGRLNAWVDWNRDGDFLDAGEQIASDQSVATGTTNL